MLSFFIKRRSPLFFILFIFLLGFLTATFFLLEYQKLEKEIAKISLSQISSSYFKKPESQITLFFVGDIMLNRGVEWAVQKYGEGNWKFPFFKIADYLKEAEFRRNQGSAERSEAGSYILFGNLEGPISDKGRKVGSIYSFRADLKAIEGLKYAGFDILSVANNHIFDYGREALEDTFLRLKEVGIDYVGGGFTEKEAYGGVVKEVRGIKVVFLAYTNLGSKDWTAEGESSGIAWLEEEKMKENIKEVKKQSDLIIVSFHFGDEYQLKANSSQKFFAKTAIDNGADLVIGHHPHVVQEVEQYGDGYIVYSLGNFVFDQGFSEETTQGLLLKVIVEKSKIKTVNSLEIKINQFFQPEIVDNFLKR